MDQESKTVYLTKLDKERLTLISRHTGYPESTVMALALNYLYEADTKNWPMRIPQSVREQLQMTLIQNNQTLKEWVYRNGFELCNVNMVLKRLDEGKKTGWGQNKITSLILDKLEEFLGRDDLRFIHQDSDKCYDKYKDCHD